MSEQTVTLLVQISRQIAASNGGSSPDLSYPNIQDILEFPGPTAPSIRINVFWFMSLVFSLSAVLFATIVQQWVRDYMHQAFRRYNHPVKRARIRQFLIDGADFWHMEFVVDTIPTLIHISLALFFVGLGEFLFNINTTVAAWTILAMSLTGICYILSIFAPVLDPQSPFQSPVSGLLWMVFQKTFPCRRRHSPKHRKKRESVSANMTEGRAQIAMNYGTQRQMMRAV